MHLIIQNVEVKIYVV